MSKAILSSSTSGASLLSRVGDAWTRLTGTGIESYVHNTNILRIAVTLVNGQATYAFQLKSVNNTTQAPYERKLDEQDVFFASAFRIGLVKVASNKFTTNSVFTYPDATIFSVANEATQLAGAWIGSQLNLNTNGVTQRLSSSLSEFSMYAPERILSAAAQFPQTSATPGFNGFVSFDPIQVLAGGDNNTFQLNWGPYDLTALATTGNTLLLDLYGVQVVGGSSTFIGARGQNAKGTC